MKLNIKEIRQAAESVECNLVCVQMVLEYFGKKTTLSDIKKKIKLVKIGSYLPQSGSYFQELGYKTKIITQNPFLFTNKDRTLTDKEIYIRIEERKSHFNKTNKYNAMRHFKDYLDNGGKISVRIPSIKDVEKNIKAGNPIICIYTSNFLLGDKPGFNFHAAVVSGFDDKYVFVTDPLWDKRGGKKKYLKEDFFFGLWGSMFGDPDNGAFLTIKS